MEYLKKTRFALLSTSLLNEPLTMLYAFLPFIIRKDLGASAFQIALFFILRPAMSMVSFYWSATIEKRRNRLRSNLIISGVLSRIPFLFCLFIDNIWYLLFASAVHMLFLKGGLPAWMEILRLNLPKDKRDKLFSLSSAMGFVEGVLLALGVGIFLDSHHESWRLFACGSALLGLMAVLIQWRLPIRHENSPQTPPPISTSSLIKPWKTTYQLMKSRPDFAHFQWGFMIGGFGIMLVMAALPFFLVDVLQLSHTNFTTARSICMGFGFALSSSLWARALKSFPLTHLTSIVCLGFGLFPLILTLSSFHLIWLYVAFIVYGITQGGSHIIWHLSGPLFAKNEDSSQYSAVNVCMVGVRGLVAPIVGNVLCCYFAPYKVLLLGAVICFSGTVYILARRKLALSPTLDTKFGNSE